MQANYYAYLLIEDMRKFFVVLSAQRNIIHRQDIKDAIPLISSSIDKAIAEARAMGYRIQNAKDPYCA